MKRLKEKQNEVELKMNYKKMNIEQISLTTENTESRGWKNKEHIRVSEYQRVGNQNIRKSGTKTDKKIESTEK
ncbi:MAG: hypothetical protein WC614_00635 [bacterium]